MKKESSFSRIFSLPPDQAGHAPSKIPPMEHYLIPEYLPYDDLPPLSESLRRLAGIDEIRNLGYFALEVYTETKTIARNTASKFGKVATAARANTSRYFYNGKHSGRQLGAM